MSYHDWHVGMKVVFAGGSTHSTRRPVFFGMFSRFVEGGTPLTEGTVYTVKEIGVGRNRVTGDDEVGIKIDPDPDPDAYDIGYYPARNFRPVQTRKTSIAIFQAMLNPSKVRADA